MQGKASNIIERSQSTVDTVRKQGYKITKQASATLEQPLKYGVKYGEDVVKNSVKETVSYAENKAKDSFKQLKRFTFTAIFIGCFAYGFGKELPKLIHKEYKDYKKALECLYKSLDIINNYYGEDHVSRAKLMN